MLQNIKVYSTKLSFLLATAAMLALLLLLAPTTHADNLVSMSDEFDGDLGDWTQLNDVENVGPDRYDILTTENGKMVTELSEASTWYQEYESNFTFKLVTGDFVATTDVKVTNKDGTGKPNEPFSLAGMMAREANTHNWLFYSLGEGEGNAGYETEDKTTQNATSQLELTSVNTDNMKIAMIRLGSNFAIGHQFPGQDWQIKKRFSRPNLPGTMQVGMHYYQDYWPTASYSVNDYVNTDNIPSNSNSGLRAEYEYFRFKEPNTNADMGTLSDDDLVAIIEADPNDTPGEPDPDPVDPVDPDPVDPEPTDPEVVDPEPNDPGEPMPVEPDNGIGDGAEPLPVEPDPDPSTTSDPAIDTPQDPMPDATVSFPDVQGHWGQQYIEEAATLGFFRGYDNGLFGPDDAIPRWQAAIAICRAFYGGDDAIPTPTSSPFVDIPQFGDPSTGCIELLKNEGVVTGYNDGSNRFGRDDLLQRDQGVTMVLRAAGVTPEENLENPFLDIDDNYWGARWVKKAYALGIVQGVSQNRFDPAGQFSRAAAAKVILETLEATN